MFSGHLEQTGRTVFGGNIVPGVQELSERSKRSEPSDVPNNVPSIPGHVLDMISMLRLNIGSGKLSSCMLSIGLGPKCEKGKGAAPPLALNGFGSSANAEHA